MAAKVFEYKLDTRFFFVWWPLGVRVGQGVTIENGRLTAQYGRVKLSTSLNNIDGGHITENYSWAKAIGIRMSFADDGLTFGTNTEAGVCIHFKEPVGGALPGMQHSALTVTVDDCDGLVRAIGKAA